MVFLFYNKWLLRLLVLLCGASVALVASRYFSLLGQKLPEGGARDAMAIIAFLVAGWLAMLVAEVVDSHYVRVLGCLCVGLGGWVSYPWLFIKDGPSLLTLPAGPAAMQQINIFFWAAMGIAGLMLLLLVVRLILDKANAGRLPAAVASMRHDRVLSSPGPDASAALVNGSGLGNGVPAPSHLEPELPPIPVDTSPLNVRAGDGDLGAQEAAVAVQTQRSPAPVSRLLGIGGLYVGQVFSLSAGEHSIGRQDSEILLADDTQVSRRHAMISVGPDGLATLTDSGSTNGSYVNEQRVSSMQLAPGDTLRFGTSLFKVEA
ncbi:FHA domain-containing protein [bacterium]|nr:FHA domain-containing protein [bacterium]